MSLSVSPVKDRDGRIVGAAKIARDISDRRRAEAERERLLREAQQGVQLRDIFLSVAGHELRTPLNALKLQLYNLERSLYGRGPEGGRRESADGGGPAHRSDGEAPRRRADGRRRIRDR